VRNGANKKLSAPSLVEEAFEMEDTIKLDRKSFEALAAESRVRVLKALTQRRKTLSELAKELGLSASTMKEHLGVLSGAGLVIQRDEGRKWKYYELTRKGKGIVKPHELRVLIMLAVSLLLVVGSGWNLMNVYPPAEQVQETGMAPAPEVGEYALDAGELGEAGKSAYAEEGQPPEGGAQGQLGGKSPEGQTQANEAERGGIWEIAKLCEYTDGLMFLASSILFVACVAYWRGALRP
jgi:DNA-binding transcriptional ArsR family regulator